MGHDQCWSQMARHEARLWPPESASYLSQNFVPRSWKFKCGSSAIFGDHWIEVFNTVCKFFFASLDCTNHKNITSGDEGSTLPVIFHHLVYYITKPKNPLEKTIHRSYDIAIKWAFLYFPWISNPRRSRLVKGRTFHIKMTIFTLKPFF